MRSYFSEVGIGKVCLLLAQEPSEVMMMMMMTMMMRMTMILIADYSQGEHQGSDPGLPGGHHPIDMELLLLQKGDLIIIVDIVNKQT